jgi:ATP/maltotriose-dependent transcriptional regulator MalT/DNA-binding SARP family transcriptional activator
MPDDGSRVEATWPLAKTSVPRPRNLVSRPRLLHPLNAAASAGQVTLIVAPGGSGKSSLLADWAAQAPTPVAWYTMDRADRDTRRLVAGICAAVERACPAVATAARRALDHGASDVAATGLLLGELEGHSLTIVLDDFHHLDDRPEATALWEHLFRFRPARLSLVILSRTVPLLGFAMLAAMDSLLGLGRTDLSFSAGEAAELLACYGLDPAPASHFVARTDGWATGVLMLARSAPGGIRLLRARADALLDQLGGEILNSLTDDLRGFVLESAVLGPATVEQVDAILGRQDSRQLFAEALARGLFLALEGEQYRFHDLFAEFFTAALRREQPERLRLIRERAATCWLAGGDLPRALGALADDENWPALAAMLEEERGTLWSSGLWGTAIGMVERLPEALRSPRVQALAGSCHAQRGDYTSALACANDGMAIASDKPEWLRCAVLQADVLQIEGRFQECCDKAEAALHTARELGETVAVTRLLSILGRAKLGLGLHDEGKATMLTAIEAAMQDDDRPTEAIMLHNLAWGLIETGDAAGCEEYLSRAAAIWTGSGNTVMQARIADVRAHFHMLNGDLEAAERMARDALSLLATTGDPVLECDVTATLATACLERGDNRQAETLAETALELADRVFAPQARHEARRVLIGAALARRERALARQLIDESRQLAMPPIDAALLNMLDGMLALRSRAHTRAAQLLAEAAQNLTALHRPQYAARANLLRAEAVLLGGSITKAEDTLNLLTAMVEPLGCEAFLRPTIRFTRQVVIERLTLRRLRRPTRNLLERLCSAVPSLAVVDSLASEDGTGLAVVVSPFGPGSITLADRVVEATILPPRARELLFYASRHGGPVTRADLLETLWDGDTRAAPALWDASRHLRRVLGERNWHLRKSGYQLGPGVRDTGRQFEAAALACQSEAPDLDRLAAAESALELSAPGPFLDWCDSQWVQPIRADYDGMALRAAMVAGGIYEHLGRTEEALATYRRAIASEPLDEQPRLALIRCLSANGQLQAAITEYRQYRALLREELAEEPSPALRQLVAGLRRPAPPDLVKHGSRP